MSPVLRFTARRAAHAVKPATPSAPATSQGTSAGLLARLAASTTAYSAWADRVSTQPMTSSPAAAVVTPGPSRSTTPARSLPCPLGNVAGHRACSRPSRIFASPGLMPAALTRTSTCPAPGSGTGTSATLRTSTSPYSSKRTAFIRRLQSFLCRSPPTPLALPVMPGKIRTNRQRPGRLQTGASRGKILLCNGNDSVSQRRPGGWDAGDRPGWPRPAGVDRGQGFDDRGRGRAHRDRRLGRGAGGLPAGAVLRTVLLPGAGRGLLLLHRGDP